QDRPGGLPRTQSRGYTPPSLRMEVGRLRGASAPSRGLVYRLLGTPARRGLCRKLRARNVGYALCVDAEQGGRFASAAGFHRFELVEELEGGAMGAAPVTREGRGPLG